MILNVRLMTSCVALVMATLVAMPIVSARNLDLLDDFKRFIGGQQKAREMQLEMERIHDHEHGVKMGVSSDICDNGVDNTTVDWNPNSYEEIACKKNDIIDLYSDDISIVEDVPGPSIHICFPDPITYDDDLPLSGPHRPLWPVYGEYRYLPPQRWVHTLEHGAIVFLYHPCEADKKATQDIKDLLNGCLWKRVISPYRKIPKNKPYAILAYQHALLFSQFDPYNVDDVAKLEKFIETYAFTAPESHALDNGQYFQGLLEPDENYAASADNILYC